MAKPEICTGRKTPPPRGASGVLPVAGEKRGSFTHLKTMLPFIAQRRATCATDTPAAKACAQINPFSWSDLSRFFCPVLPALEGLKMPTLDAGRCPPQAPPVTAGTTDGNASAKGRSGRRTDSGSDAPKSCVEPQRPEPASVPAHPSPSARTDSACRWAPSFPGSGLRGAGKSP